MTPPADMSPEETAARLPYEALCRSIADILPRHRFGLVTAPERMAVPLAGGGVLLIMPAAQSF